jgi:hypothetical protein
LFTFAANNQVNTAPLPLLAATTAPSIKQTIVEAQKTEPTPPAETSTPQALPSTLQAQQPIQTPMLQTGASIMTTPICSGPRSLYGLISLSDFSPGPTGATPGGTVIYQWEFSGPTAGVTGLPPTSLQTAVVPAGSYHTPTGSYLLGNITQEILVRIHVSSPRPFTHSWVPIPPPCSRP